MTLDDLLDRVRDAVARADFSGAAGLAQELESALAALPARTPAATLARLKAKAARNAACLDAAKNGLRAARRRMEEVRRASQGIQTYNIQGKRAEISPAGRTAGRF